MMMRPGDILGRIFYIVTEINHRIIGIYPRSTRRTRIIGSSEFRRMLNGYFFGCASARNLWGKSLIKIWPVARNNLPLSLHKYNL